MKMGGLLRLHVRHSSILSPVYPLRFPFLVFFTVTMMSCLTPSSRACLEPFHCGNQIFTYPFQGKNSGCGDPALQLDCDPAVNMPLININGYEYYIYFSEVWYGEGTMRVIHKNQWGEKCNPLVSNHTREDIGYNPQFRFPDEYNMNLTRWEECPANVIENPSMYLCNDTWYINLNEDLNLTGVRKSSVTVPASKESFGMYKYNWEEILHAGFLIRWNLNETCRDCDQRGSSCAHNIHSMEIYCDGIKSKPRGKAIMLGGISGSAALLLMVALLLFLNRKSFSPTSSQEPDLFGVEKFLQDYVHQMPCRYSYSQLMKITNKFAHKVGEGGFGVVYKGKLPTGELVAVKMLDQSRRCENQFMNEVATLGRIHHVHLVRLMGYFYEEHRNALVYEYMANGSLDEFIFAGREKEAILNRAQLYSIALGAALGIAYLHQDCDNRIIHFDIKPHNILLDVDLTPKIADFGLAKLCGRGDDHISMTAARGTPGYAAPEVWNRHLGSVTDKSDVYSFGMVLLELVGGRKNIDVQASRSSQLYFPEWAFKLMEKGELERGLRRSGKAEIGCEEKEKAIVQLAKVGMWCIQYNSRDRPSMSRVVQMLEGNCDDVGNPPLPFNSSIRAAPSVNSSEESSV